MGIICNEIALLDAELKLLSESQEPMLEFLFYRTSRVGVLRYCLNVRRY